MSDLGSIERERRERQLRERTRARAARGPQRSDVPAAPTAVRTTRASRVDEQHEGLLPLLGRLISAVPLAVVRFVGGVGREIVALVTAPIKPAARRVPAAPDLRGLRERLPKVGARAGSVEAPLLDARPAAVRTPAQERARERRRALLTRRLRGVAIVLVIVGAVVAWRVVPASDAFRIRHVEIIGTGSISDLQARASVDSLLRGKTIYTVDTEDVARRIERMPFVRTASVDRHFPGGLTIRVVEHRPLALGYETKAKRWWLISPDGRVLTRSREREWRGRIPLVRLSTTKRVHAGMHLDTEPAIDLLRLVPSDSTFAVSSVQVRPFGLTITVQDGVRIRFGRPIQLRMKLAAAERMFRDARQKGRELAYIDVAVPGYTVLCMRDDPCATMPAPDELDAAQRAAARSARAAGATPSQTRAAVVAAGTADADTAAVADDGSVAATTTSPGEQGPNEPAQASAGARKPASNDAFDAAVARAEGE